MAYEQILTETRGRVGIIRLNRPARLNAWTAQMGEEVRDQIGAWNRKHILGGQGGWQHPATPLRARREHGA